MFSENDAVRLKHEIESGTPDSWPGVPSRSLKPGAIGTVVMVYQNGTRTAYEVEFVSQDGTTQALLTLTDDDLEDAPEAK